MSVSLKHRFGNRVRQYRRKAGLTQEQLAEAVDVSVVTISHIERGIHGPKFDLIDAIAATLNTDAWDLFEPNEH